MLLVQIYTQLTSVMSKVFFPGNDPAVQALSIWGIFAVGFISRPVGALLFGHMGDTRGRGLCLLVSGGHSSFAVHSSARPCAPRIALTAQLASSMLLHA
jgi:MHS family proline/betaine transporter-like MFS transporter